MSARSGAVAAVLLPLLTIAASAQAPPDIETVLARVAARIEEYYRRAQHVICIEKTTMQPIERNFAPAGFARSTEAELRVESDGAGDGDDPPNARVVRLILKVNGRPPREKDKKARAGCTDPNPLSPEPLAFLLPARRADYTFTAAGFGKGKDRDALVVEFASRGPRGGGDLIEDPNGHEDCFDWSEPLAVKGRVWVDAGTYEVLRIEQHILGPADVRVKPALERKHNLPDRIVIDRLDTIIRYKPVVFKDPEEAMLLPQSIETIFTARNALQSMRRSEVFSDYRRFMTEGRVVK